MKTYVALKSKVDIFQRLMIDYSAKTRLISRAVFVPLLEEYLSGVRFNVTLASIQCSIFSAFQCYAAEYVYSGETRTVLVI